MTFVRLRVSLASLLSLALAATPVAADPASHVSGRIRFDAGARLTYAYPIALDEAGERLYVGGYGSDNVVAWDLEGRAVLHENNGVRSPHGLKFLPGRRQVVVLGRDQNNKAVLVVLDRDLQEVRRIVVGDFAYSFAVTADESTAYVGAWGAVVKVDLDSGAASPLGDLYGAGYAYPFAMVVDEDRGRLLVVASQWVFDGSQWVFRSAVVPLALSDGALGTTLVLGDRLFSYDAVLDRDELFIANTDDNSVHLVDAATLTVVTKIEGVSCPQRLVLHPGRKWLYVIDNYLDRFHVIDRVQRRLVKTIYPGDDPSGLVFDNRGRCYMANYWSHDVTVVDVDEDDGLAAEVKERFSFSAASPHSLWYDAASKRLTVSNGASNGLFIVDAETGRLIEKLVMPAGAFGGPLAVSPERERIFVADDWRSGVGVYPMDLEDVAFQASHAEKAFIPLPGVHPSALARAPGENLLVPFVKAGRLTLGIIDEEHERLDAEIDLGAGLQAGGVAVNPAKDRAYVADYGGAKLFIVDLKKKKVLGQVPMERQPGMVAVHPVSGLVYVCNPGSNSVAVVADEPAELLGFIDVGAAPSALAFVPTKARLYVLNSGDGTVSVVDEREHRVVETVDVGSDGLGLAADPASDTVFVASPSQGQLTTFTDPFRLSPQLNKPQNAGEAAFAWREGYAYPNPARGVNPVLRAEVGLADVVTFSVFDLAGGLVHQADVAAPSVQGGKYAYEHVWDVGATAPGVYLVTVEAKKSGADPILKTFKAAVLK